MNFLEDFSYKNGNNFAIDCQVLFTKEPHFQLHDKHQIYLTNHAFG
jgi:hypothetical protein